MRTATRPSSPLQTMTTTSPVSTADHTAVVPQLSADVLLMLDDLDERVRVVELSADYASRLTTHEWVALTAKAEKNGVPVRILGEPAVAA